MTQIQLRRDTASNWSTNNPIPAQGEPCYETDTNKLKFGDGTTHYNDLDYFAGDATPYVLPVASDAVLGGIKVGDGLSITEDGVLSSTGGGTPTDVYTKQETNSLLADKQDAFEVKYPLEYISDNVAGDISISGTNFIRNLTPPTTEQDEKPNVLRDGSVNGHFQFYATVDTENYKITPTADKMVMANIPNTSNITCRFKAPFDSRQTAIMVFGHQEADGSLSTLGYFSLTNNATFNAPSLQGGYQPVQKGKWEAFRQITGSDGLTQAQLKPNNSLDISSVKITDYSNCYVLLRMYRQASSGQTLYRCTIRDLTTNEELYSKGGILGIQWAGDVNWVGISTKSGVTYPIDGRCVVNSDGETQEVIWDVSMKASSNKLQLNYNNTLLVNEDNQLSVNTEGLNIPTATSDLINDSGFITKEVNDLTNYTPTSSLATVATTGSYNDLTDKPTIPSEYVLPAATTTTLGGVKPDGTTITITEDGTITAVGGGGDEPTDTYTKEEIDNKLEQKQNAFDCALPLDLLEAETYGGGCWAKSSGEDEYYYMPSLGLPIQYAGPVVTREGLPMEVQYVPVATSPNASAFTPVEYNGAFSDWQSDYHIYYEALKVTDSGDYPNYFFGFCNYFSASKNYAPRGCIYGKTTDSNYTFTMMVDLFGGGLDLGGGNVGFNFTQGTVLATTTIPLTYLDSSLYYLDFHFEGNDFKIDVLKKADNGVAYSASFGLDVVPSFNTASAVIMPLVRNVSSKRIYNANYFKVTDGEGNVVWSPAKQPTYGNNQLVLKYNDTLILSGEELSVNTGNLATKSGNNIFTGENTFNQSVTFGNTGVTPEDRTIFDASLGSGLIAIGDTNASLSLRSSGNIQVNSDVMVTSGNVGTYAATTAQGANADTAIANLNGMKFWSGTQAEYDGLETKDNTTLYIITGE